MKKNVLTKGLFAALLLASTVVVAEEYPATDYQPTVVYSDSSAASSESSEAKPAAAESSAPAAEAKAEKAESSSNMLVGLVVLAVAGGFFLSKKQAPVKQAETASAPVSGGYSGGVSGQTGVERYLQSQNASAATGVEKYLAKKEVTDKEASLTGVDKYLRNRG